MFEHLRRLATTGAAYTAASVLSKLIALFLLPIYTAYLSPADYGAAEVMLASLVAASIIVRLGVIEAILRFYYLAGEDPKAVVRTAFASLFWTTTIAALIALPFAGEISEALLEEENAGLPRLAILGPLAPDAVGVRPHPPSPRRAGAALLHLHDRPGAGDDPGHGRARGGDGPRRFGDPPRQLRDRSLLPGGPPVGRAQAARASLRDAAASPHAPLRAADDAGGADALLALLPRPDHHRPPRRPGRGRASMRSRSSSRTGCRSWSAASTWRGRRSRTRSPTTTRPGAPTP